MPLLKRAFASAKVNLLGCLVCTGLGVFFIFDSFKPMFNRFRSSYLGTSINPIEMAIGVVLIVCAWLLYKSYFSKRK